MHFSWMLIFFIAEKNLSVFKKALFKPLKHTKTFFTQNILNFFLQHSQKLHLIPTQDFFTKIRMYLKKEICHCKIFKLQRYALSTTIQYQRYGHAKAVHLLKFVKRENLEAGKFCVHWDPLFKNHNIKPVLISHASIKCVQSWGIWGKLRLYTSISL